MALQVFNSVSAVVHVENSAEICAHAGCVVNKHDFHIPQVVEEIRCSCAEWIVADVQELQVVIEFKQIFSQVFQLVAFHGQELQSPVFQISRSYVAELYANQSQDNDVGEERW